MPTLWNTSINFVEGFLQKIKIVPSKKRVVNILHVVNGIVRPSRMTLLLGPLGSGKTTLLKALAGVPDKDLRVNGRISYCGHELSDFIPQRTRAYISQHDVHHGEMTVRETLDFAGCCLGVGTRMTLLLGPLGSGKATLLKALAGVPDKDLRVNGRISYCGHELSDFIPQRTCAYISQHDVHHGEMTVRETLDFAGCCLGVGTRYELLTDLSRHEKDA
ncbi:hypothetical protein K7X08_003210 [Anisodus acutangulus]|uniref:ABC transporter domain-containing protein n=1 Tax=Anisodus acutangulus TaxID=402998 RepID=A0A9Q1MD82_9SOLA|nr:hypothetical protein K7X08_003210 [Anisodus acutangulus]